MEKMGLLVIFYWVLILLIVVGALAPASWEISPKANTIVTLVLFIIIGIKMLKPTW